METSLASTESGVRRLSPFTWLGLAIALFGMIVVRHAVLYFSPTLTVSAAIWSESLMWVCIVAVCLIIRRGEKLPFSSIGLGTLRWSKSLGWGVVLTVGIIVFGSIADLIAVLTHYQPNEFARQLTRLPVWLLTLTCMRAGVGEELFYRGYAIERLQALGLSRFWAAAIPILIFSVGHWTSGWQNVVTAFIVGSVLAAFYLWRRDLLANMIAHFLVDFIGVVVPRLFS
ncbi:MAG: type II CAAX endopeptidase family protein [Candidatus Udaeobacter sp.]